MEIQKFLKSSPSFAVLFTAQFIAKQMTTVFKEKNLTYLQAMVLVAIFFEKSSGVRPNGLAKFLNTSKGNISHCLAHLQTEKLIQYEQMRADKRGSVINLTAKGKSLVASLIKYFDEIQKATEKKFTDAGTRKIMSEMMRLQEIYEENPHKLKA